MPICVLTSITQQRLTSCHVARGSVFIANAAQGNRKNTNNHNIFLHQGAYNLVISKLDHGNLHMRWMADVNPIKHEGC